MDDLTIIIAAGKALVVSSEHRKGAKEVIACQKLVTRSGVQQQAAQPKRQQFFLTLAGPLEK